MERITTKQVMYIQAERRRRGINDELYAEMKAGIGVTSTRDLTPMQFESLLARIEGRPEATSKNSSRKPQAWKRLHKSAKASGMHRRPDPDKENVVRKIEAILTEQKLPWSYVDGMARRMFKVDKFVWCDAQQTYKIMQALVMHQLRRKGKSEGGNP